MKLTSEMTVKDGDPDDSDDDRTIIKKKSSINVIMKQSTSWNCCRVSYYNFMLHCPYRVLKVFSCLRPNEKEKDFISNYR